MKSGLTRYLLGLALVVVGVLWLLDGIGVPGLEWMGWSLAGTYWPLLLVGWGLWGLVAGGFRFRSWAVIVLLLGVAFQLSELGIWNWSFGQLWPALIVIAGLFILLGRRGRRGLRRRPDAAAAAAATTARGDDSRWSSAYVFNAGEEQVIDQDFPGGEAVAVFGSLALDLREAALAGGAARLDVTAVFGGVELKVPPGWRVNRHNLTAVLGSVEQSRQEPAPEQATGELTLTGTVLLGRLGITD